MKHGFQIGTNETSVQNSAKNLPVSMLRAQLCDIKRSVRVINTCITSALAVFSGSVLISEFAE